jgi:hypothetical protein
MSGARLEAELDRALLELAELGQRPLALENVRPCDVDALIALARFSARPLGYADAVLDCVERWPRGALLHGGTRTSALLARLRGTRSALLFGLAGPEAVVAELLGSNAAGVRTGVQCELVYYLVKLPDLERLVAVAPRLSRRAQRLAQEWLVADGHAALAEELARCAALPTAGALGQAASSPDGRRSA